MNDSLPVTEYIHLQILKSMIQNVKVLSWNKDTTQSECRETRIKSCKIMVSTFVYEQIIFWFIRFTHINIFPQKYEILTI